jgi:hypothetical protein
MNELRNIFENNIKLFSDKWTQYFDVYETYFSKYKNKSPVVVEVGVQGGGSIQMWEKYFGEGAKIYGIDIDKGILNHKPYYGENTKLFVGDQQSPEFWDIFLKEVPEIDVFIDDGGHTMQQQIVTFEKVFPHMSKGGIYICEDTHTSYFEGGLDGGGYKDPNSFIEYSKELIDIIYWNYREPKPELDNNIMDIHSIAFFDSMVVFIKGKPWEVSRILVNEH